MWSQTVMTSAQQRDRIDIYQPTRPPTKINQRPKKPQTQIGSQRLGGSLSIFLSSDLVWLVLRADFVSLGISVGSLGLFRYFWF